MPLDCFKRCQMTKCPRFFQCPEHWDADELAEMRPDPDAVEDETPTKKDEKK